MRAAAGFRHGIVLPPRRVRRTAADPRVVSVAIPLGHPDPWSSVAGGAGRDPRTAEAAALGEALERYSASVVRLPRRRREELRGERLLPLEEFSLYSAEQRRSRGFPYADALRAAEYTHVFSLLDGREHWAPVALVGLGPAPGGITTSTGLAAGRSAESALLRAAQELVERDALAVTWLHGVRGRRVDPPATDAAAVEALGGDLAVVDATPAYSPHPVALVAGRVPLRGRPRAALGAACRATWAAAAEKAFLEWAQAVVFAGHHWAKHPELAFRRPEDVRTFEDHAVYYTVRPDEWERVPLLHGEPFVRREERRAQEPAPAEALRALVEGLAARGIRLFYRDVTARDVRQAGVRVVRALSPELVPLAAEQGWPYLGGTARDVLGRYPWARDQRLRFPNPLPHPLG